MTPAEYTEHVDLWADDIYRFTLRCCNVKEHCEDAVQEAFAALWERLDSIKLEEAKRFLFTVAKHKLFDRLRHDKVVQQSQAELQQEESYEAYRQMELKEVMNMAMQQLSETQRAILQLHDIEGYGYNEVAEILKLNYKQVQVYAFRAKVKLKQILIHQRII